MGISEGGGAYRTVGRKQLGHMYNEIISLENLCLAWEEFILGKRKKKDVLKFSYNLMDNIVSLHNDLVNHTYHHGGYESFFVNDPKRRHIHKASVRDRLLHHAVYRILYPFFERTFIPDSFSCRLNKGTHKAINRFRELANKVSRNNTATCWVLKGDIRKFFASIDHDILLNILGRYIPDKEVMGLLRNIVESFCTSAIPPQRTATPLPASPKTASRGGRFPLERGKGEPPLLSKEGQQGEVADAVGLPLGNLTSQLFANVYLNVFDRWVKHRLVVETRHASSLRVHYIRYADDFVFLSRDKNYLLSIIPKIQHFLSNRLKLTLHPNKIILKTLSSGADFLGWVNFPAHRVLRRTTRRRMFNRLRDNFSLESLQSYLGLLGHGQTVKIRGELLLESTWLRALD